MIYMGMGIKWQRQQLYRIPRVQDLTDVFFTRREYRGIDYSVEAMAEERNRCFHKFNTVILVVGDD